MFGHCVYFTLKDNSRPAVGALVDGCHKYLSPIPGIVFFAAGTRAEEMQRAVNDRDFDVALHVVFTDKAAHDAYQMHDDHAAFIQEHSANWEKVRVFDSQATGVE